MSEITWNDLYELLRRLGFEQAADLIEEWQDEWLPGQKHDALPKGKLP